jgi:hypothetical protein
MRRTTVEKGELCLRHQKCDTQGVVSIVVLSTAAVTKTLLHTKSEFIENLQIEFPLQFNISYSMEGSQIGDLRFLSMSRTFWKYFSTCSEALALKYSEFPVQIFFLFSCRMWVAVQSVFY